MEPFTIVTGPAAPLMMPNIDTDVIIRIERLAALKAEEMGDYAFEVLRYRDDGSPNPDFVFNREPFRGAPILIAGTNFGCGSSREAAVWALKGLGLRVVIADSFGDIFAANCFQNGILPITLPPAQVESLAEFAVSGAAMTVDLHELVISGIGLHPIAFKVDASQRKALLEGADEIDRTLQMFDSIVAWQARDKRLRPWVWANSGSSPQGAADLSNTSKNLMVGKI
ncbi:3-isopropylmalate dehydratase small subunit [Novosphingobium pentaromativorans]|uniref:3-isopropylmalate dehydratase n=1 Tax=Novosphingobium pentaromativorans US6-1 TaxID=1088721 RepID=G6EGJ5_9SPHN|nr:3-isopropylmalate dehydratase small subunit [Novosphingobium pentaromativorans]EHJ59542.1 Alpha-IPM isomerase [Novosphingobium pentaromativorans US6-1]